jgi:hypothetical protein
MTGRPLGRQAAWLSVIIGRFVGWSGLCRAASGLINVDERMCFDQKSRRGWVGVPTGNQV